MTNACPVSPSDSANQNAFQLWNQGAAMQAGIALLLRDAGPDLAATVHAIELADRTGGAVHAIFTDVRRQEGSEACSREGETENKATLYARIISLANWWGEKKGVRIHLHLLENLSDASLYRLCLAYRISCLVSGVDNRNDMKREELRVVRLRKRMAVEETRSNHILWSFIIPTWQDFAFKSVITHFEKAVWWNEFALFPGTTST
jgi:hypothetical protein